MCNFGAWEEWMSGIRSISSYLYAETKKYQERLLNKIYLDTIKGYILQDNVGAEDLKNLTN